MENFDIEAKHIELGTEYGKWPVCTEVARGHQKVYSIGVGADISWDLGVIKDFDATIHAYDPTPFSKNWIARQSNLPRNFHFHDVGLAAETGLLKLAPPTVDGHVSFHVTADGAAESGGEAFEVRTLDQLMRANRHDAIDILKMDIEGAEFAVIDWIARGPIRPTQILVEFHHEMYGFTWSDTTKAHRQLYEMGYQRFYKSGGGAREQGFVLTEALGAVRAESRGVVYFAFGPEALKEANISAGSLKESNPGVRSAIFTDRGADAKHDIVYDFNAQQLRDIDYHFVKPKRMPSIKVRFLMDTPFERTAVLDADTYVKGDLSGMFDILDDHDLALTNMPRLEQGIVDGADRPVHKTLKELTHPSSFSCAVFAFRKSPAMRALAFEWWSQYVERTAGDMRETGNWGFTGGINEQAILHLMMADGSFGRCRIRRATLPNVKYNAGMTMWARMRKEGLWDDCSILHSHLIFQKYEEVGIEGLPDLPDLQKFL